MDNSQLPNPGLFSIIDRINEYPGQPKNERYHKKMLQQLQTYHSTAKSNKEFSLVSSLEVLSKFVITDFWLSTIISEEIRFLKLHNVENPYHPE
jgi:hypothetical protein